MSPPVAHLYAHIPFCPSKCHYCAFVTHIGSLRLAGSYMRAVAREAERLARLRPGGPLSTVYFGGGTPSMLEPEQIGAALRHFQSLFGLESGAEVTMEAHPSTVNEERLAGFRAHGVTRISFGAESMNPAELSTLGRSHEPSDVERTISAARGADFESVAVDLMYGLPGQSLESWRSGLLRLLSLEPDHLSLYPLSIEPKTLFFRRRKEHRLTLPSDDRVAEMYAAACETLRTAGYEHYEVANWARAGHRCRHNLSYWMDEEYYAVGVGAHGYLHPHRTANLPGTKAYIARLDSGASPVNEVETLDSGAHLTESVTLGMRLLADGLDLGKVEARHGVSLAAERADDIDALSMAGLVRLDGGRLYLEEDAVPVANEIWERFLF